MEEVEYRKMYAVEDTHWWFLAKRLFVTAILPRSSISRTILDLGSGTGGMTQFLSRYGDVTGVEASSHAHPFLKKRNVTFRSASVNSVKLEKNAYDLITLFDVLYHRNIRSDVAVLKQAHTALKKGGYLVITDSALPWLTSSHDDVMHGRERYAKGDLASKVSAAGFTIERASYMYFFVFPLTLLIRLLNKFMDFENVGEVNPMLNTILLSICRLEAYILNYINLPIGSSVILLAKK